jgi:hypothetical protein
MNLVSAVRYAFGTDLASLETSTAALIADGYTVLSGPPGEIDGKWVQAMGIPAPGMGGEITIADVTGLQAALTGKADAEHTHGVADITDLVIVSEDEGQLLSTGTDGGALLTE